MPISVPLDAAGLPGCTAVASGDGFNLFGAASAAGKFSTPNFTVPNDVSLLGVELAAQAIAVDAGANAAGLVASRGLLVLWGWKPGFQREPVSTPYEKFIDAWETWDRAGAPCP